jgi:hypothetical protein
MQATRPKAADLPDRDVLAAVYELVEAQGYWTNTAAVHERFASYPFKVVAAKLKSLYKRGLVSGCPCGCRGDWELTWEGRQVLWGRLGV